jgi:acrylyl-CoA reductase (NADPH)
MELPRQFKALVVRETSAGRFVRAVEPKTIDQLPAGDVLVQVAYSSLNFKDALSASGNRGVTRTYPHTPGIDAAGWVAQSNSRDFTAGDNVIVTSYDLGMNTPGGFGQYIRVPADWVVPLPQGLTLREAMIYGTAGFTAAISVRYLIDNGITPQAGDILVSGATGGVGSLAVSILAKLGYAVTAINGREDATPYLRRIGAREIISIDQATDTSGKALLPIKWAGAVDTVGGDILTTAIRSTGFGGTVTCCGNAASADLALSVYPFILRGVHLVGINSQSCPMPFRRQIWQRIATDWKVDWLDAVTTCVSLDQLDGIIERMLQRKHTGRTIIEMTDQFSIP